MTNNLVLLLKAATENAVSSIKEFVEVGKKNGVVSSATTGEPGDELSESELESVSGGSSWEWKQEWDYGWSKPSRTYRG